MEWLKTTVIFTFLVMISAQNRTIYRLSDNHVPKIYTLRLNIDPNANGYSGEETIIFSTKNRTNNFQIHASPQHIKIIQVILNGLHTCIFNDIHILSEIATITCPNGIEKSEQNQIFFKFTGVYGNHSDGLNKAEYQDEFNNTQYIVVSEFSPLFARKIFPCFDEPQFKAVFDVMIIHPDQYKVLSNTDISFETTFEP